MDTRIALAGQPVQLDNPLNNMAKAYQIRQLQMAQADQDRALAQQNAMNEAWRQSGGDVNKLRQNLIQSGQGAAVPALDQQMADIAKSRAAAGETDTKNILQRMELSRQMLNGVQTPQDYLKWHMANHADPVLQSYFAQRGITAQDALGRIQQSLQQPGGFEQLLQQSKMGIDKSMETVYQQQNLGGSTRTLAMPKYGDGPATVVPGSEAAVTKSPNAPQTNIINKTEGKYGQRFAEKIAEGDAALYDQVQNAPKAAENADRILDILDKNDAITGAGADWRLPLAKYMNLVGDNNEETIANTETLMAGMAQSTLGQVRASGLGSGQGFTDKDREFVERAAAGNITYDKASIKRLAELSRKAAQYSVDRWNKRVKEMPDTALEGTGVSRDDVKLPARPVKNGSSAAPKGMDQGLWDHMTPEERALWTN